MTREESEKFLKAMKDDGTLGLGLGLGTGFYLLPVSVCECVCVFEFCPGKEDAILYRERNR
jgi:hypothetical protein